MPKGKPLPTVGDAAERKGQGLTAEDRENIARVMQVPAGDWVHLSGGTLGRGIWPHSRAKVPSKKQARQGVEILRVANEENAWQERDRANPS